MRWSPVLLLLLVALVVGGLVLADLGSPSEATDRPAPVAAGPAVGGAWYCAAGAAGETDDLSVLTAMPPGPASPSDTEIRVLDGDDEVVASQPVFPGSARLTSLGREGAEGDAIGAATRWWDAPVATSRVWQLRGEGPGGYVSGPCASGPSPTWYVPGMSTAGGSTAHLHLANPFPSDASVEITLTTPTGPEAPILLENVSVPGSSVTVIDLAEHVPRQADVGVTVRTRAGRVVVEGVQRLDAAIGGVDGVALVRAAPRLAETWTIPWSLTDPTTGDPGIVTEEESAAPTDAPTASDEEAAATEDDTEADAEDMEPETPNASVVQTASPGGGTASWLWVSNPADEPAAITVTLHTPDGPVVPDIGDEVLVDGGEVLRVDLRGLLPAGQSAAGVTVRSENGVPVVAGAASLMAPEGGDPDQTGYTSQLGWPSGDASWVVPGERSAGRQQVVHLVNPGADPAVVDLSVWDGAALRRQPDLEGLTVAPGALLEVDVTEVVEGAEQMAVFVDAHEGEVVAGRHSVGGDVADWVAHTGVPSGLWAGGDVVPPVDHDAQLIERLGTAGGLPSPEPGVVESSSEPSIAPPSPAPSPTSPAPSPTTPSPTATPEGTGSG
jgi:hypothetical protein